MLHLYYKIIILLLLGRGVCKKCFSFLLNNIFDAANEPNKKRINSIKFQTKLVLICTLHNNPFKQSRKRLTNFELKLLLNFFFYVRFDSVNLKH